MNNLAFANGFIEGWDSLASTTAPMPEIPRYVASKISPYFQGLLDGVAAARAWRREFDANVK